MAGIVSAHHVGLTVENLERSKEFYMSVLGFEEVFSWNPTAEYLGRLVGHPDVDLHATILSMPGTNMHLELLEYRNLPYATPVDADNCNPGTAHLAFYVDDLDTLFEDLMLRGVACVSSPVRPTLGPNAGGKAVYMIDPDGFRIELIETKTSFAEFGLGISVD